jgi:hypothetical protein
MPLASNEVRTQYSDEQEVAIMYAVHADQLALSRGTF